MMESTMDYPPVVSMNTPIKKIRNLTLNSPPSRTHHHSENKHNRTSSFTSTGNTEALYPTMDDIQTSPTASTMLQKGYSQRLTNNVLAELNSRAQEISQLMGSPTSPGQSHHHNHNQNNQNTLQSQSQNMLSGNTNQVMNRRNKRYSGIHFSKFKQMESINLHYSVHVKTPSPQKTDMGTSSSSSMMSTHGRSASRDSIQHNHRGLEESASKRRRTLNGNDEVVAIPIIQKKNTIKEANSSSPMRKISPSKGSRNLNSMLRQTTETGSPNKEDFIKPYPPSFKLRPSSLEMAGVLLPPSQQHQQLDHSRFVKPMAPSLQKKSSIPTLNKKSSIPSLRKAPSIPSLQKNSSIPTLNRKSSIPTLQKKSSMSSLNRSFGSPPSPPPPLPHHQMSTLEKKPPIPQFYNNGSRNTPHLSRVSPSRSIPMSSSTKSVNSRVLYNSTNQDHTNNNTLPKSKSVTIPQPFSYDKPTISSSQKSLNKFQKFKDKFT
ncbi:hypothetical protein Cantr_00849 [Candida viswanathii]|uniref:Uncharacterized protein n=1 Tax=Candida viswanathii TaxID=5486 RepID=A0A367YFZ6_9ASCO|nr:hypothetical protein Cantr_00849 [Candida viswanathii]